MICDCHLHTCFSGDSETPVRDQLDRAIALGMQAVCITDHHDWDAPNEKGEMDDRFLLDFPRYIPALREIRDDVDFAHETALVEDGLIDSLDLTQIIAVLDELFSAHIPAGEIEPENFNSVDAMLALAHHYQTR